MIQLVSRVQVQITVIVVCLLSASIKALALTHVPVTNGINSLRLSLMVLYYVYVKNVTIHVRLVHQTLTVCSVLKAIYMEFLVLLNVPLHTMLTQSIKNVLSAILYS